MAPCFNSWLIRVTDLWVLSIETRDGIRHEVDNFGLHAFTAKEVVWGNAGLAHVGRLAPQNPLECHRQVAVVCHVAGTLTSQLQSARGQVPT